MGMSLLFRSAAPILAISCMGFVCRTGVQKIRRNTGSPILLLLIMLLFLVGCAGDVIPGESAEFRTSLDFYMDNGMGGYVVINEEEYPTLLAGAEWVLDDGLELVEANLSLSPAEVTWTRFETKYTAQGASLTSAVQVRVSEDAKLGLQRIRLRLPGLQDFGSVTRSMASFPALSQGADISEGIPVAVFTVHETAASRNMAVLKRTGLLVAIGVVVVGILLFLTFVNDWLEIW